MLNPIEKASIDAFREGSSPLLRGSNEVDNWIAFGLAVALEASKNIRGARLASNGKGVAIKGDGSPATELERKIEARLKERLASFEPSAIFVGEETGGELPSTGWAVAMDPVDGTWGFLTRTETYATTIAVFRDGVPFLAVIANPTTGEIAYSTEGIGPRFLLLSSFGEGDHGYSLPLSRAVSTNPLVNVHPSRSATALVRALYENWGQGTLRMVRSPGGSPAWALVEAAKGDFVYVNLWARGGTEPWDLAAGVLIVRQAGGRVTDLDGQEIDALTHKGPFVASIDRQAHDLVVQIAKEAAQRIAEDASTETEHSEAST